MKEVVKVDQDDEDLTLFEREEEGDSSSPFLNVEKEEEAIPAQVSFVNDENANLASNLIEGNKALKKTVTKIQKDKVKFIPANTSNSQGTVISQTLKFEQGALSKMSMTNTKEKFETIINSAGLRGLIMNPIICKT